MVKTSKPTILHLTVDQLHRSDLNVRKKPSSAASDAEVSASLLSVGLIQPMVVIPREAGGYEVVAGDRRRRLLTALAEADPSRKGMTFPCMKVDDLSKVTEISMAENRAREAMSLPDVYKGFAAIRAERPEATLEELGAMFGYDVARTARIMRIANLHPEIMDLYSAGEIGDAEAQAYAATEDRSLQIAVYRQLEQQATRPHEKNANAIRKAMGANDILSLHPHFTWVERPPSQLRTATASDPRLWRPLSGSSRRLARSSKSKPSKSARRYIFGGTPPVLIPKPGNPCVVRRSSTRPPSPLRRAAASRA